MEPTTEAGRAGWAALRAEPGRALVALDYDGVLAPIVDEPSEAWPAPGAVEALQRLAGRVGTLAVVTGRPAEVVVALGGLERVPGLLVEGQYGAERWAAGSLTTPAEPPGVAGLRAALPGALAAAGADPAVWVEDKRLALVVHTRRAADPDGELVRLGPALRTLAGAHGLEVHPGKRVLELRPPGFDKGGVLRRLVETAAPGAVLFAGDDVGDLPAFAVVAELRAAGTPGLAVASASAEAAEVAERADLAVDGPAGVVALLGALADGLTPGR
ncbi:MAG TPA: trehalose-phosphatase [Mycobacteriales bacterium]|jgi:trehalose 6-phosphate phosphatase|nr:trehalose-phosphatase [Mycobacteriales bacterium]